MRSATIHLTARRMAFGRPLEDTLLEHAGDSRSAALEVDEKSDLESHRDQRAEVFQMQKIRITDRL